MSTEDTLSIWTVYDHPTDYPDGFIARRFDVERGSETPSPTHNVIIGTLEFVRDQLQGKGLTKLARHPSDDPKIVESWI